MEKELANHILRLEAMFFGLTPKDLRKVAYQWAERNKLDHPFSREKGMAGEDWLNGFLKRNNQLSLRKPEATSYARASAFNLPQVTRFFDLLEEVMAKEKFPAHRIFNMDETGISIVHKPPRIVGSKERNKWEL